MKRSFYVFLSMAVLFIGGCGDRSDTSLLCRGTQTTLNNLTVEERIPRVFGFTIVKGRVIIDGVGFNEYSEDTFALFGTNQDPYSRFSIQKDSGILSVTMRLNDSGLVRDFEGYCYEPNNVL